MIHTDNDKPRLVVLLGAGSTIHANAPSTTEITQHVEAHASETTRAIFDALKAQHGASNINFERLIYAIDELIGYFLRRENPDGRNLLGGVLSAFTQPDPRFGCFKSGDLEEERIRVATLISRFVWEKTENSSADQLKDFLDRLEQTFRLTVFTLNYDNLIDRAGEWFDGFADLQEPPDEFGSGYRFNPVEFIEKFHTAPRVLAHLHGNVQFAYDDKGIEVVKFLDANDAIRSLDSNPMNNLPPIISGFNKESRLVREPIPFGYYYHAFIEAILGTSRLLVAGYGRNDLHVQPWLAEIVRLKRSNWRLTWIDKEEINFFHTSNIRLIQESFPTSNETTNEIVKHLNSV